MMRITIPVEEGNRGVADGSLPKALESVMESLKPEAVYFTPASGTRSALVFFDLADSSDIATISEPFFQKFNASVEFAPVMNAEELQAGLARLG